MEEEVNQVIPMMKVNKRISTNCPLNGKLGCYWFFGALSPVVYPLLARTLSSCLPCMLFALKEMLQLEPAFLL